MLCKFCRREYFLDRFDKDILEEIEDEPEGWDGSWRGHHTSAAGWVNSIEENCSICIVLEKGLRELIMGEQNARYENGVNPEKVLDGRVDNDTLNAESIREAVKSWPLYRATLWNNVGDEWTLKFEPYLDVASQNTHIQLGQTRTKQSFHTSSHEEIRELRERLPRLNFVVYRWQGSDHGLTDLGSGTDSDGSLSRISAWIQECEQDHRYCKIFNGKQESRRVQPEGSAARPFTPTRLLDVGGPDDAEVRLVMTDGKLTGPYTTLSHKWGLKEIWPLSLTYNRDNHEEFQHPIPLSKFPPTFRDAIRVTRHLKIRYLWIDSLCIRQLDSEDWHSEAPKMAEVYGNSYCNIAAVDAFDARGGLFRRRDPSALAPSLVHADSRLLPRGRYGVVREDFWAGELLSQPLYKRGWVFQERMLSPRILHFGPTQIFWQCVSASACESAPSGLPAPVASGLPQSETRWRRGLHEEKFTRALNPRQRANLRLDDSWEDAVRSYTACGLTVETDKMMAMAGIAGEMRKGLRGERYCAGLWEANLHEQLGWVVRRAAKADGSGASRAAEFRAPSWSWMCLDGVIGLANRSNQGRTYAVRIEEVGIELVDEEVLVGKIKSGAFLRVKGIMLRMLFTTAFVKADRDGEGPGAKGGVAKMLDPGEMVWYAEGVDPQKVSCRGHLDCRLDQKKDEDGTILGPAAHTVLLLAYTHDKPSIGAGGCSGHGLLLNPVHSPTGSFTRIGCVKFQSLDEEAWRILEQCKLTSKEAAESEDYDLNVGHTITLL